MSNDVFTPPENEFISSSKEYGLPSVEIMEGPSKDRMLSPILSDDGKQHYLDKDVKAAYDKLGEEESKDVKY